MALVQSKGQAGITSLTFNSSTTTGNKIVVAHAKYGGTNIGTTDITDNKGNTYTRRVVNNSIAAKTAIWESQDSPTMGATHQISVTGTDNNLAIFELSGLAATPFDGSATNANGANSTPADTGNTATLAQAAEEVIAVACIDSGAITVTESAGQNWTTVLEEENGASFLVYSALHKTVAATTALSATWALGTNSGWSCCIGTFKKAGGQDWPVNTTETVGVTDTAAVLLPEFRISYAYEIRVD